jgi:hypothetical protein
MTDANVSATSKEVPSGEGRSIFISYAREDKRFANKLAKSLRDAGAKVWIDEKDIRGGDDYVKKITAAIEEHKEFLIILTPAAVKSEFMDLELLEALEKERALLPVMRRRCKLPFRIKNRQYFDFVAYSYREGLAQILRCKIEAPPWYRRLWGYIRETPIVAIFAIVASILYGGYRLMPSRTTATLVDDHNANAVTVQLQNHGGRPSTIVGGYRLKFGDLPIVDEPLDVVRAPRAGVVPGHATVPVTLVKKSGFEPKQLPDGCYPTPRQIEQRLPGHNIGLEVDVKESNEGPAPFHTLRIRFPANQIGSFLTAGLPEALPGCNHAP